MATAKNSHPAHGAARSTITQTKTENAPINPLPLPIRAQKETAKLKRWPPTMLLKKNYALAVLGVYRPELALSTTLPQKVPPKLYIPTDEDIKTLLDHIDNEEMMIAVLLAAFGPLRRSEICGLEDTDFNGNIAHIQRAVVLDENKQWVDKTTKSVAGNRYVPLPDFVMDKIRDRNGRIVT